MEFGCHTWSHPNLGRLHPHQVRAELSRSKSVIEHQLGEQVRLFAYPFGKPRRHFTGTTRDIVAQLGYARAAAVSFRAVNERDDPLAIPRFFVTNDDVDTLAAKVGGAWDWLGVWHEHGPLWMARLVSPADFNV
jgi:peptidoglycan/xylan/chitin deacetylase (PgdA/CDA1 family)